MKRETFHPRKLDYEVLYPGIDDTSDGLLNSDGGQIYGNTTSIISILFPQKLPDIPYAY